MNLTLSSTQHGKTTVLAVTGKIDHLSADRFRELLPPTRQLRRIPCRFRSTWMPTSTCTLRRATPAGQFRPPTCWPAGAGVNPGRSPGAGRFHRAGLDGRSGDVDRRTHALVVPALPPLTGIVVWLGLCAAAFGTGAVAFLDHYLVGALSIVELAFEPGGRCA